MTKLLIDWANLTNRREFYAHAFEQMQAPGWHGDNLDALNDSWVTGGICSSGPPYTFVFRNESALTPELSEFARRVLEIAEDSIRENGGSIDRQRPV